MVGVETSVVEGGMDTGMVEGDVNERMEDIFSVEMVGLVLPVTDTVALSVEMVGVPGEPGVLVMVSEGDVKPDEVGDGGREELASAAQVEVALPPEPSQSPKPLP